MKSLVVLIALVSLATGGFCAVCTDPEVEAKTYTTEDGTVITNVAYVAQFSLKCSNGAKEIPLYAEVGGKTYPVVLYGKDHYQVSWAEDLKSSGSGTYTVNLFDEEGYGLIRKAMRNNEDISSIKPLHSITVRHPGTYQGPWLNSEFLAVILSLIVWYSAFSTKSKLLL
uniref:Translocon-associated protein subunit delta n=1 Tax=Lygus hesperus TaxID=30085 RepID=A0A0A9YN69_LYGHE